MSEVIRELECKVCGHKWFPRLPRRPIWCPKCNSKNWATGRKLPRREEMRRNAKQRRFQSAIKALQELLPERPIIPSDEEELPLMDSVPAGPWKEMVDSEEKVIG